MRYSVKERKKDSENFMREIEKERKWEREREREREREWVKDQI